MTLSLYHGTKDFEAVLKARAVVCPLLSGKYLSKSDLELNFDAQHFIYLATTSRLADEARSVYNAEQLLECETEEALADCFARSHDSADSVRYKELKRNLFVYLTDDLRTARNYENYRGGVLQLDVSSKILRKGLPGEGRMVLKGVGIEDSLRGVLVGTEREVFAKFLMRAYGFCEELVNVNGKREYRYL